METVCRFCETQLVENAQFCHMCGGMIEEADMEKMLDVTITKDDIKDYLFKGYIQKDIPFGSGIVAKIRTLTQKAQVEYNVEADTEIASLRHISPETLASVRNKTLVKKVLVGINGDSIPSDIGEQLCSIIAFKSQQLERLVLDIIQRGKLGDF